MFRSLSLLLTLIGLALVALGCGASQAAVAPTATATRVAPAAFPTADVTPTPNGARDGYTGVYFTEVDGDQIGRTGRAQLLNIYASW